MLLNAGPLNGAALDGSSISSFSVASNTFMPTITGSLTSVTNQICNGAGTSFTLADGGTNLSVPTIILTSLSRTDWQGTTTLSSVPRTNLISHTEIPATGSTWSFSQGAGAVSVSTGPDGTACAQINWTAVGQDVASSTFAQVAGQTYTGVIWINPSVDLTSGYVWVVGNIVKTIDSGANKIPANTWTKIQYSAVASVSTTAYGIMIRSGVYPCSIKLAAPACYLGSSAGIFIPNTTGSPLASTDYTISGNTVTLAQSTSAGNIKWTGTYSPYSGVAAVGESVASNTNMPVISTVASFVHAIGVTYNSAMPPITGTGYLAYGEGGSDTRTITVTLEFNHAPTIDMPVLYQATRNEEYWIRPTVVDLDNDDLIYQWTQISGSTARTSNPALKDLLVKLHNLNPAGEDLVFSLTVTDSINTPITSLITIKVPALATSLKDTSLIKTTGPKSNRIALRNTPSVWNPVYNLNPTSYSDAFNFKTQNTESGIRKIYISDKSSLITDDIKNGTPGYYKRRITYKGKVLDSIHTEDDSTYLLVKDGDTLSLLHYMSSGYQGISDYPDTELNISSIVNETFSGLHFTAPADGYRVISLYGASGVLIIQCNTQDVSDVRQNMYVATETNLLIGSDSVTFIRDMDVLNPGTGQYLIGTQDQAGNSYEVLLDLQSRRIINTWDRGNTISSDITSGEFLFKKHLLPLIKPVAPYLTATIEGNDINLEWTQERYQDVKYYDIYMCMNDGEYTRVKRIDSGYILSTVLSGYDLDGNIIDIKMVSGTDYAVSDFSNVVEFIGYDVDPRWSIGTWSYAPYELGDINGTYVGLAFDVFMISYGFGILQFGLDPWGVPGYETNPIIDGWGQEPWYGDFWGAVGFETTPCYGYGKEPYGDDVYDEIG
jgi:hypothetical protein